MDNERCQNCIWFEFGWCDELEVFVDEYGWCEDYEETEDDNLG